MLTDDEQDRSRRNRLDVVHQREVHEIHGARLRERADRIRVESAFHRIIAEEFTADRIHSFRDRIHRLAWESRRQFRFIALEIFPTLLTQLVKKLCALLIRHAVCPTVAHHPAHIVHADSGNRFDPRVNLRSRHRKTAAAADADYTDFISVHKWKRADVINGCTEVFGKDVRR